MRGYAIEFPAFDLGESYKAAYKFSGVPKLGNASAQIVLMIADSSGYRATEVDQLRQAARGVLRCSLVDSTGKVITHFETPLKNMIWSSPIHDLSGYAVYDLGHSSFDPKSSTNYTLMIDYSGDARPAAKSGSIYIWCACGGS